MRLAADCAPRILRGRTSMGPARASLSRKSPSTMRRRVWRIWRISSASDATSVRALHSGFLRDLGPFGNFALEPLSELLRDRADRIRAFALDALTNVGRLQHAHDLASN